MPNYGKVEQLYFQIIEELGFDALSEGLRGTPARIAAFWQEFLTPNRKNLDTTFESVQVDQMVIVKGIPFYSLCEHHFLPFYGKATVAYITGDKVIGLSKIPRLVEKHAKRPQLQERLAVDILAELDSLIPGNQGLAVVIEGFHMCMQMRGVKSNGSMITSLLRGDFKNDPSTRNEFLALLK